MLWVLELPIEVVGNRPSERNIQFRFLRPEASANVWLWGPAMRGTESSGGRDGMMGERRRSGGGKKWAVISWCVGGRRREAGEGRAERPVERERTKGKKKEAAHVSGK